MNQRGESKLKSFQNFPKNLNLKSRAKVKFYCSHKNLDSRDGQETKSVGTLISFQEKCSIPPFVENIQFKALLDTGSTISAINSQTLK